MIFNGGPYHGSEMEQLQHGSLIFRVRDYYGYYNYKHHWIDLDKSYDANKAYVSYKIHERVAIAHRYVGISRQTLASLCNTTTYKIMQMEKDTNPEDLILLTEISRVTGAPMRWLIDDNALTQWPPTKEKRK